MALVAGMVNLRGIRIAVGSTTVTATKPNVPYFHVDEPDVHSPDKIHAPVVIDIHPEGWQENTVGGAWGGAVYPPGVFLRHMMAQFDFTRTDTTAPYVYNLPYESNINILTGSSSVALPGWSGTEPANWVFWFKKPCPFWYFQTDYTEPPYPGGITTEYQIYNDGSSNPRYWRWDTNFNPESGAVFTSSLVGGHTAELRDHAQYWVPLVPKLYNISDTPNKYSFKWWSIKTASSTPDRTLALWVECDVTFNGGSSNATLSMGGAKPPSRNYMEFHLHPGNGSWGWKLWGPTGIDQTRQHKIEIDTLATGTNQIRMTYDYFIGAESGFLAFKYTAQDFAIQSVQPPAGHTFHMKIYVMTP